MIKALLGGLLAFITACEISGTGTKIQYMPDMADSPTVKSQESYLDPPPNSIAMNAILYPKTIEAAEEQLRNPYPGSPEIVEQGKVLYDTFCAVCHGSTGIGGGPIEDVLPGVPNITSDVYSGRKDGFFFHRITFGMGRMPGYGHAISANERWYIIHYLRKLQGKQ